MKDDEVPKYRGKKKNTKKWCKGKPGREHKLSWKKSHYGFPDWMVYSCDICNKVLDSWYPYSWMKNHKPELGSTEPLQRIKDG